MEKLHLTLAEKLEGSDSALEKFLKEPGEVTILVSRPKGVRVSEQNESEANKILIEAETENGKRSKKYQEKQHRNMEFELHVMTHEEFVLCPAEEIEQCYVVKRVAHEMLRSVTLTARERPAEKSKSSVSMEEIENLCLRIRMPPNNQGFQYVVYAVKLVLDEPGIINRITKDLYPRIALEFGKTDGAVERAIRHSITNVWDRGNIGELNRILGPTVCSLDSKPTNGEFIGLLATCFRGRRTRLN